MKKISCITLVGMALFCFKPVSICAADVLTPGFLKLSLYTNIVGTAVADLTADPNYPASPGEIRYLRSLNTRDALPTDAFESFGGRIEGFLTPLEAGDYHFFLRSDDASELWLGTDDTEASASMIAEERDSGDVFREPDLGDAATSQPITLVAGKRYFIMVLYKSSALAGNSTDYAKVAWRKVGDTTLAETLKPIPAAFLSTMASAGAGSRIAITLQPQNVSGEENSKVTFSVAVDAVPTNGVGIVWQRNGVNIPGATGTNYVRFLDKADHGANIRAVAAVPGIVVNSAEATVTVTDDKTRPALLSAKGGPNRPEVTLTFSERLNPATATDLANSRITGTNGTALAITEAIISADRTQVTLKTEAQNIGMEYTVTVNNIADTAVAAPNTVAANSQAKFFARGPWLQGDDGFVVWEAEDYDRNLDGLWMPDTERGLASGGVSMVNNNGAGGNENGTKLEYDIYFTKTGTNILWWRFSGNDGNDDSAYIHLDGARIPGREAGNLSVMGGTGTSLAFNWGWISSPFEGGGQMTFVIDTPGVHSIGVARREDGSFVDKFLITTDPRFVPTTGFTAFGPQVTLRQGEPLPTGLNFDITQQPVSTNVLENTALSIPTQVSLPAGVLSITQWQRKQGTAFVDIPGSTSTNLSIPRLTMDWNGAVVRLKVSSSGITKYSNEATITVTPEKIAPDLLGASGLAGASTVTLRFSEPLNATTAQAAANYQITGPAGAVAVTSATLAPSQRTVFLATGAQTVGTKYTVTVSGVTDQAAAPNAIVNGQAKFYSAGDLQGQGADGLLVFEAESYNRNLDGLWIESSARGNPSGGNSVVVPTGGSETSTQLEYDLTFTKTGTNILWYRASGADGSSDSTWFWLDGARPANRTTGNQASMTGFSGQADFVWLSNPQDGGGQMTFIINAEGPHVVAIGRRENNAYFDKFVITTDPTLNPGTIYGAFGPPESRAGLPPMPTINITSPAPSAQFNAGVDIPITVDVTATTRSYSKIEFFRGTAKIGESTTSPYNFTWQNAPVGTNNITARLTDDVNDTVQSRAVAVIVSAPQNITVTAAAGPGGVVLTWTAVAGPYTLQKKNSLSDATWVDVLTTPNTTATVPTQGASGFFRIVSP